jgi:outer membrane protein OmpA-like peptidoglycan-associated protein
MNIISTKSLLVAIMLLVASSTTVQAEEDAEGCMDHPLFNRMPNYYLYSCEEVEFGSMKYPVGKPDSQNENLIQSEVVEGKVMAFSFQLKEDKQPSSGLQIMRNFQNASKQNDGVILGEYEGWCSGTYEVGDINSGVIPFGNGCTSWSSTFKFEKENREIWVYVQMADGGYDMVITEKEAMRQDIQANEMFEKINAGDTLTLYINFESGKSVIKNDSQNILDELYKMLSANPALKIIIEGHTDNVGNQASNKTLSEERALSVQTALASKGILSNRIQTVGYGQDKPIADNASEEGKAKNRRVEIKKQ